MSSIEFPWRKRRHRLALPEKFQEFEKILETRRRAICREIEEMSSSLQNTNGASSTAQTSECDLYSMRDYLPDILGFIGCLGESIAWLKTCFSTRIERVYNKLQTLEKVADVKIVTQAASSSDEEDTDEGFEDTVRIRRRKSALLRIRSKKFTEDTGSLGDDEEELYLSSGFVSEVESIRPSTSSCSLPSIVEYTSNTESKIDCKTLYAHEELPTWMRNNEYILSGHRPPLNSYAACIKSIFQWHSETGNIWTHLIGSVLFAILGTYALWWKPVLEFDTIGWLAFAGFFCGAVLCMGFSAFYHTVNCHSPEVCHTSCKLDYSGIVVLILSSFYPWIYYHLYCNPMARLVYTITGSLAAVLTLKVAWSPVFGLPKYRGLRSAIFIGFGLCCGVLPALHYALLNGFYHLVFESGFVYIMEMIAYYVIGAVFYAFRVPEKFIPGRFDLVLHSHQIMHIFVIFGTLAQFNGCYMTANYRLNQATCDVLPQADATTFWPSWMF